MNYTNLLLPIDNQQATYHQLNDSGIEAHFYPANGFPVGTYHSFLNIINQKYKLHSLAMRACWSDIGAPMNQTKFDIYANDLVNFIKQIYTKPIVGIGHSQGATCTLMAAAKHPQLFSKLILIEPASMSKSFATAMKVIPYLIKKHKEPFKTTLKKSNIWKSKKDYFNYCRQSKAYKRINDKILEEIVHHSLREKEGKFHLVFPSQWEASNYAKPPNVTQLFDKIDMPIQIIAGKPNLFFNEQLRKKWSGKSKHISLEALNDFGHLIPFEAPKKCAEVILNRKV